MADLQSLLRLDSTNKAALKALNELLPAEKSTNVGYSSPASGDARSHCPTGGRRINRGPTAMRRIPIVDVGGVEELCSTERVRLALETNGLFSHSTMWQEQTNKSAAVHVASTSQTSHESPMSMDVGEAGKPDLQAKSTGSTAEAMTPAAPTNWFQLECQLRELIKTQSSSTANGDQLLTESAANFLLAIPPEKYDQVIGQNLEASLLANLLRAYHRRFASQSKSMLTDELKIDVGRRLHSLSRLPRFDVIWLMADQLEHQLFEQILECVQPTSDLHGNEQLAALIGQIKMSYL